MKCIIPGQNVKILARALHSLARVGDEVFVDPLLNELVLRTVNSAQSAFAEYVFMQSFFSSYSINVDSPDSLQKCKISMKSCLSVFKTPHSMDKLVDWCQLHLEPDGVQLVFKLQFTGGSKKTYFLPVIECETLQVNYKKTDSIKIVASAKLLSGVVRNFRLNEDEITLAITKQKTTLRNHLDTNEKSKTVRTELALLAGEFEMYCVNEPVSITFCLKQLRAVVAFAEPAALPVTVYFEAPGRPVIFSVCNESVYEANFVVSSLTSVVDIHSQDTQNSDVYVANSLTKQLRCNPSNLAPNCSQNLSEENILLGDATPVMYGSVSDGQNASRKRLRDLDEADKIVKNQRTTNNISFNNSGNRKSVDSNKDSQDTVLIENNEIDESIPNSPGNSPKRIVGSVFGRCFNSTFQKSSLPGFNKVLAYDSDGLEDSD